MLLKKIIARSGYIQASNIGGSRYVAPPLPRRNYIKLYEYEAARMLKKWGLKVPRGQVGRIPKEAYLIGKQLIANSKGGLVIKAQVHGGGRGKGYFKENNFQGGVHLVENPEEAEKIAGEMIGNHLVTKQSGEDGVYCEEVYVVEKLDIEREMYIAITSDRKMGGPVLIYSTRGGVNIEEVARDSPNEIHTIALDINGGVTDEDVERMAKDLDLKSYQGALADGMKGLYELFKKRDCTMVEINPLVVDRSQGILCADSKITIDQSAEYRQKDLTNDNLLKRMEYKERIAHQYDLNYIHIGGNIGCLVNGAGLAMATMDIIKYYDGTPANFLDLGGGAEGEQIIQALKLLSNDNEVKSIFINIFGGIVRCDFLATAIVNASKECGEAESCKPVVLRMKGTKVEEAKVIIAQNKKKMNIHFMENMDDAAQLAVQLATRPIDIGI